MRVSALQSTKLPTCCSKEQQHNHVNHLNFLTTIRQHYKHIFLKTKKINSSKSTFFMRLSVKYLLLGAGIRRFESSRPSHFLAFYFSNIVFRHTYVTLGKDKYGNHTQAL